MTVAPDTDQPLIDARQAAIGVTALLVGVAVYLFYRPAAHLTFVPVDWFRFDERIWPPAIMADILPDFLHVFGFSVLTGAFLDAGPRPYRRTCLAWTAIDVAFELGQWPPLTERLSAVLSPLEYHNPEVFFVRVYFERGEFDRADLAAIAAGAAMAYMTLRVTGRGRRTKSRRGW